MPINHMVVVTDKLAKPGLQAIIDYALQQSLIPRKIAIEDLFDDTTHALEG